MVKILLASFILLPLFAFGADHKQVFSANDKKLMNEARAQFAASDLQKAIQLYSKVPAGSDFWLESIEERAWSWTRLNEYENALADLQSITSPVWRTQVGPETYMLSAFVSLKMCDYKEVLNKINLFKKRMLFRVESLEKLQQKPLTPEFMNLVPAIKQEKISLVELGHDAELYPRYFFRDKKLIQALQNNQMNLVSQRLKEMAKIDLAEIQMNLKKMKIIEVEMMQVVLMSDKNKKKSGRLEFSAVDRKQKMIFPVTDDEVWLDEVGQYQVRAQKCASAQKRTL